MVAGERVVEGPDVVVEDFPEESLSDPELQAMASNEIDATKVRAAKVLRMS